MRAVLDQDIVEDVRLLASLDSHAIEVEATNRMLHVERRHGGGAQPPDVYAKDVPLQLALDEVRRRRSAHG